VSKTGADNVSRSRTVESVFSHFYIDALGPLFNHKTNYNYCLIFLDHTSRFPHAVALCNLTAKSCCEAMLSLWQFTGMPTKVTTDRATNFTGELTREFLRRVGCSPIWCTPRHPEANSVEQCRHNQGYDIEGCPAISEILVALYRPDFVCAS